MAERDPKNTCRARFFKSAVENPVKTKKAGRAMFDEVEMVTIVIPGDKLTKPTFEVTDKHRRNYPDDYAAFLRGEERAASGTPLEHWPIMTTSKVAELKAIGILSVDELADLSDSFLQQLGMGGRELREQARAFRTQAANGATEAAAAKENTILREQIELLKTQMAELSARSAPSLGGSTAPAPVASVLGTDPATIATATGQTHPSTDPASTGPDKAIEDCSADELKAYIKRETGAPVLGNPSLETLVARAKEVALGRTKATSAEAAA